MSLDETNPTAEAPADVSEHDRQEVGEAHDGRPIWQDKAGRLSRDASISFRIRSDGFVGTLSSDEIAAGSVWHPEDWDGAVFEQGVIELHVALPADVALSMRVAAPGATADADPAPATSGDLAQAQAV